MKMTIGTPLPPEYEVGHNDLAESVAALIAHALLPLFAENMSEDAAKANVQGILTELAYIFDEGEIVLGGKSYRPRLAFVDEAGQVLPGAAALNNLHEMVEDPFDITPEAQIRFEEDVFVDE
ncbi:hypothetical protein [Yoonia sp. 2307UL14-13]|uniref:hypothetical protein n=1 Tax=Yoonia sp. 2307UL14-13 TaxID=3126506 RepID=UPI00309C3B18